VGSTLTIVTTALPGGTGLSFYSATLAATGGQTPYSWTVTAGNLPTGLALGTASGTISGTLQLPGTSNFTVTVTDANGVLSSRPLSIVVSSAFTITSRGYVYAGQQDTISANQAATWATERGWRAGAHHTLRDQRLHRSPNYCHGANRPYYSDRRHGDGGPGRDAVAGPFRR